MKKVLVGSPISKHHAYCINEYIKGILSLTYQNFDVLLIDNSDDDKFYNELLKKVDGTKIKVIRAGNDIQSIKNKLAFCRNILRKKVIDKNYDFLFCIDQDIVCPIDSIERLIESNKEVISGIYYSYFRRGKETIQRPVLYRGLNEEEIKIIKKDKNKLESINKYIYDYLVSVNWDLNKVMLKFSNEDVAGNKVIPIKSAGTGCVFISNSVLKQIEFHTNENEEGFDDVIFFRDVENLGIQAYAHTAIKCFHSIETRPWSWEDKGNDIKYIEPSKSPKILVGAPVSNNHEYCTEEYIEGLKSIDYGNYDILLIDNSKDESFFNKFKNKINIIRAGNEIESIPKKMVFCRNILRKKVIDENYDFFLNLDQDVIPPNDIIKKMLKNNKDIITGIYYSYFNQGGKEVKLPIVYGWFSDQEKEYLLNNKNQLKLNNPKFYYTLEKDNWDFNKSMKQLTSYDVEYSKFIEIKSCGTGCIFISKKALIDIEFRENNEGGFDDVIFCKDALSKGYKLYADTSIKCDHKIKERPWTWKIKDKDHMIINN